MHNIFRAVLISTVFVGCALSFGAINARAGDTEGKSRVYLDHVGKKAWVASVGKGFRRGVSLQRP